MNIKAAALAIIAIVVLSACLMALLGGESGDGSFHDDYQGYDARYSYTTSGSDTETYASCLTHVTSDSNILYIQSALEGYPLKSIAEGAFEGCSSRIIVIPSTVESMPASALDSCGAESVVFLGSLPDGIADSDDPRIESATVLTSSLGSVSIEYVVIGGEATIVGASGDGAFDIPGVLESEDGSTCPVVAIGCDAFRESGVTVLTIPEGVTRVQTRAFYGCESLISVDLPDSIVSLEDEAFRYCTSLADVDMNGAAHIGFEAFRDCRSFINITISDTVVFLGDGAFYVCRAVETVYVGAGIDSIPDRAFGYCDSIVEVEFGSPITEFGSYSFYRALVLTQIDTSHAAVIGSCAFLECRMLAAVDLGSIVEIADNAFGNCRTLTSVTLPDTLEVLGSRVFSDCRSLADIYFLGDMPEMQEDSLQGIDCTVHVTSSHGASWSGYSGTIVVERV